MKKVSLLAFLLATVSTAASADPVPAGCPKAFQGFHLGANIGYGVGTSKHKISDDTSLRNNLGINGVDGGIGTGYTHRFGNWGLGLVFDANWSNSTGKVRVTDTNGDLITSKARLQNSLQLWARTGYVIVEKVMPFIGLGWDNSSWKHSVTTDSASFSKSKRLNAFLWKCGVDFLASKHVVMGVEYTGTSGGRNSASRDGVSASFKPQYNKFAATLKVVY